VGYVIGERVLRPAMVGVAKRAKPTVAVDNTAEESAADTAAEPPETPKT
jgi:hypothetical protein